MKKISSIILILVLCLSQTAFSIKQPSTQKSEIEKAAERLLKKQILAEAAWAMQEEPITVTASFCTRSAGGKHDFFSEADYFWPDPKNPDCPYIDKDGMTNPR